MRGYLTRDGADHRWLGAPQMELSPKCALENEAGVQWSTVAEFQAWTLICASASA